MDGTAGTTPAQLVAVSNARRELERTVRQALAEGFLTEAVALASGLSVQMLGRLLAGKNNL